MSLRSRIIPGIPSRPSKGERGVFPPYFKGGDSALAESGGSVSAKSTKPTLREDFPFLSSPTCPPELKILAANKITAYHNYCAAHKALYDCTNPDEQFQTVKQLVENFIENRQILDEFEHYKQHNHTLGVHPIFKEFEAIRQLRSLSSIELYKKKKNLEHNIWRIESQLKDAGGKSPGSQRAGGVNLQREKRLQQKKNELAEVERLLIAENPPSRGVVEDRGVPVIAPAKNHPKGSYWFDCPGCKGLHVVNTSSKKKPCWGFNNDLIKPTFTPSILTFFPHPSGKREVICHSFVTDGKIRFLKDCPHKLKGKTVPLPPITQSGWFGKI